MQVRESWRRWWPPPLQWWTRRCSPCFPSSAPTSLCSLCSCPRAETVSNASLWGRCGANACCLLFTRSLFVFFASRNALLLESWRPPPALSGQRVCIYVCVCFCDPGVCVHVCVYMVRVWMLTPVVQVCVCVCVRASVIQVCLCVCVCARFCDLGVSVCACVCALL